MERKGGLPSSGVLEWFGYHECAQGWLFFGSINESLSEPGNDPQVVARGLYGEIRGAGPIALFASPTNHPNYTEFAAFLSGEDGFLNELGTLLLGDGESLVEITVPYQVARRSAADMEAFLVNLYDGRRVAEFGKSLLSVIEPLDAHSGEHDGPQTLHNHRGEGGHRSDAPASPATRQTLPQRPFMTPAAAVDPGPGGIAGSLDAIFATPSGMVFFVGWADDRFAPIRTVAIEFDDGRSVEIAGSRLMRLRRQDAEQAIGLAGSYHLGFCGLAVDDESGEATRRQAILIRFSMADGEVAEYPIAPQIRDALELRDLMLAYLANAGFFGDGRAESFYALDGHFGDTLIRYNLQTTKPILDAAIVERFGNDTRRYKASFIVCLYGKAEFQFLQNALFSAGRAAAEIEYIYVSNSPELLEAMRNSATMSQRVYGLDITLVMLPGNAGFGAANNIAARHARSDRLMIVNPDVFPMRRDWAERHEALLASLPKQQSRLFGPRLFYADGSLMHAGMYLDRDTGLSLSGPAIRQRPMLRVEHYGKGAPGNAVEFLGSRPVSAVSGAFMSVERDWFERLGGFSEDYIFGHYEDADLCLRSLDQGVVPWVHDLEFWHLEGKGSTRLPHHEGASTVNRWLFTGRWHDRVVPELLGRVSPMSSRIN